MKNKKAMNLLIAIAFALCSRQTAMAEDGKGVAEEVTADTEITDRVKETPEEDTPAENTRSEVKEGQRKAAIKVVSIIGNELTYYELKDEAEEKKTEDKAEEISEKEPETDKVSKSDTDMEDGGANQTRGHSRGNFNPDEMVGGQIPENMDMSQMGKKEMSQDGVDRTGRMNMETQTVYLPVPVVVHTDAGEEMTFSILQEGDELEVLFEEAEGEEMIIEIWIKDTKGDDA